MTVNLSYFTQYRTEITQKCCTKKKKKKNSATKKKTCMEGTVLHITEKNISTASSFILVICEHSLRQCYALKEYCNTVDCFDMNIPSYNKQSYV